MKYKQGSMGRVIVAKLEHGDDLLQEINNLLRSEGLESGILFMIGALQSGSLVVGPEWCSVPPEPMWKDVSDGREVVGIATVFSQAGEPGLHFHAALGRGDEALTGCIRKGARVYLVVEVIVLELVGTGALRTLDPLTGMAMLGF